MLERASLQHEELGLRGSGAVGRAGSLALAAVLAGVPGVSTALALAIVLALAGVLGGSGGLGLRDEKDAGVSGRSDSLSSGLSVQAGISAAKNTCECGREGQVMCGVAFHG